MEDWNWFFTAFAQCNAAIVGFIGGFTINKILNRETDFSILNNKIDETIIDIENQKKSLENRYFDWYNNQRRKSILKSDEYTALVRRGSGEINFKTIFDELNFSIYDSKSELKEIIQDDWNSFQEVHKNPLFDIPISPNTSLINVDIQKQILEEREYINKEDLKTEKLVKKVNILINKLENFPNDIKIITKTLCSIIILFIVGVIYPLSFTPVVGKPIIASILDQPKVFIANLFSLAGFLLLIVTLTFSYIIQLFIRKIRSLKIDNEKLKILKKNSIKGCYSEYFANIDKE